MVGSGTLTDSSSPSTLLTKWVWQYPYNGVNGEYRYLVNPATATTLSCSFKDGGETRGFVISPTIAGGNYKEYTVK